MKKDAVLKSALRKCMTIFTFLMIIAGLIGCGGSGEGEQALLPGLPDFQQPGESILLAWEAPENEGESTASGYRLYYGQISGDYSKVINVGNFTSCSVDALSAGTWYFVVTAYDSGGNESDYSNEVSYTVT